MCEFYSSENHSLIILFELAYGPHLERCQLLEMDGNWKDLNDTILYFWCMAVKFNGFRMPFVFLISGSGRMSEFMNSNTLNKQALRNKVQKFNIHGMVASMILNVWE